MSDPRNEPRLMSRRSDTAQAMGLDRAKRLHNQATANTPGFSKQ